MKTRRLGKTGYEISEIGLGCWQFGGDFGPTTDDTSRETMRAATEAGVTFFDTADVYGGGRSERVIGGYLKEVDGLTVATKLGRNGEIYASDFGYDMVRAHLEQNCENLGVECVDLIQLHCIPTERLREGDVFAVMDRLQSDGLCKNWGASVETIEEAQICLRHEGLATLQIIFNLFRQDAVWELFDDAKKADVGIIVRLPLASGLLAGKYSKDTDFAESDHRNYNRDGAAFSVGETFGGIPFEKGIDLVEGMRGMLPPDVPMAQSALRWILDHDAVSTIIAGCSSARQVQSNARASEMAPLPTGLHAQLKDYYQKSVRPSIRGGV
ncbi:aldo/keto reductase [Celeribacter arenosi]|uniref:Aldo/keto reductase n=1 Tax=Celeribacter arenosi TaxID=792649 RepID=A0ABP7K0U6_9RHOB